MNSSKHGLQPLITPQLLNQIKALKDLRAQQPTKPALPKLSFKHLNPSNLEAEGFVHLTSSRFSTKPVPYCGNCNDGWADAGIQIVRYLDASLNALMILTCHQMLMGLIWACMNGIAHSREREYRIF